MPHLCHISLHQCVDVQVEEVVETRQQLSQLEPGKVSSTSKVSHNVW